MKSKKKLLLLGVGAMGALAMGVGATSTFAWYTAAGSKAMTSVAGAQESISTDATAMTLDGLYLVVTAADQGNVALTTSDGYSYAIVNNVLRKSNATNTLFNVANLSIGVYTTWDDTTLGGGNNDGKIQYNELSGSPSAEDIHRISDTSVTMRVTAQGRTRVANYATSKTTTSQSDFASLTWKFGSDNDAANRYVTITVNIDKSQDTVANAFDFAANNDKVFYSISGEDDNATSSTVDGYISTGSGWKVDASLPSGGLIVGPNA